ncbi:MAG: hypothetical protein GY749_07675 [Desulfobacteraceae bacterium]|nr:hypothetical protein [Desulfobacteraceae bacterium]
MYFSVRHELTTRQLKEFAREQAIISALTDYDRKLKNHNEELVTLLHQIKYLETGFVPETETYCVKLEGVVYPIELLIASSIKPDSQDADKSPPANNPTTTLTG